MRKITLYKRILSIALSAFLLLTGAFGVTAAYHGDEVSAAEGDTIIDKVDVNLEGVDCGQQIQAWTVVSDSYSLPGPKISVSPECGYEMFPDTEQSKWQIWLKEDGNFEYRWNRGTLIRPYMFNGTVTNGTNIWARVLLTAKSGYAFKIEEGEYKGSITVNGIAVKGSKAYGDNVSDKQLLVFAKLGQALITHNWDKGTVIKEPTYTEEGEMFYQCTTDGCTAEKTEPIPKLQKESVADAKITGIADKVWTGEAQKQNVVVTLSGKTLQPGTDYTVAYKDNTNVGKATMVFIGTGIYTGTAVKTFNIDPKGTGLKSLKKAKKAITVRWKKQASKMSSSRITGYQIQLAKNKKFTAGRKTVNVKGYKKVSRKIAKLKRKTKYYVRIRTYKTVGGVKYYSAWSPVKSTKTK